MDAERCLIVNADDFGRNNGINLGVIAAHQHGIVTSASLTVRWPSARAAAAYARASPGLGVGLHVDLGDWAWRAGQWQRRHEPVDPLQSTEVEREVAGQLARFRDLMGVDPTHLDSHHRAHRREPLRTILRRLADKLQVPLRHETPDVRHCGEFYGQTRTGRRLPDAISTETLVSLLAGLGPDPTELACHPALGGGGSYAATGREEVRTLCDARVRQAVADLQVGLRTFGQVPIAPREGRAALARGDGDGAVRVFARFARRHGRHVWPWLWLARAHRVAGDVAAALKAALAALAVSPGSPAVANQLVELLAADAPSERRALQESLVALVQHDDATVRRLSACLAGLRSPSAQRARELIGRYGALALAPGGGRERGDANSARAEVARCLEVGDAEAAWRAAETCMPRAIGPRLLARAGAALEGRGQLSDSLHAYTRAAGLRPDDGDIAEAREAVRGELAVLSGRWATPSIPARYLSPIPGRILHVVGRSLPDTPSGYAFRTDYLVRAQRARGLDAHVVTELGFPGDGPGSNAFRVDDIAGVPYHRLAPGSVVPNGLDVRLTVHLAALVELVDRLRPSVLHAASDYRNALLAHAVARARGLPVVYEVRGFWEETWRAMVGPGAEASQRYLLLQAREAACARAATAVVTLGQTLAERLASRGVARSLIHVVANGVDTAAFVPQERDGPLASALGIEEDDTIVGYVSSLNRYEGIEYLLTSVAALVAGRRRVVAVIVGDGPDRERLERLAFDLGIASRVRFTGRVPHDDVVRYYSLIDVFVVPRTSDWVSRLVPPLKPLEAMAAGKALVVSDVDALRELVVDGKTGRVFNVGDSASLAAVLEALVDDPSLRARLGSSARRWVSRHRTWAQVGRRYAELYETLSAGGRPSIPRTGVKR